jgi:surface protein
MNDMFESCTSISSLDLSSFDTSMVTSMDRMFANCLSLTNLDVRSFVLTVCISFIDMFTNTTRELMLEIEKNEELLRKAGNTWSENNNEDSNVVKIPLDILFLVDATGSMGGAINKVKMEIIYIAVNLLKKEV